MAPPAPIASFCLGIANVNRGLTSIRANGSRNITTESGGDHASAIFTGGGTSESRNPTYRLHLTDRWPPRQNSNNDKVSSGGPRRFAHRCRELALASYTTLCRRRGGRIDEARRSGIAYDAVEDDLPSAGGLRYHAAERTSHRPRCSFSSWVDCRSFILQKRLLSKSSGPLKGHTLRNFPSCGTSA